MHEQRLQFVKDLAWKAGQLSLEGYGRCDHSAKESADGYDMVTEYDHRVEQLVRAAIEREYGEPVLGEEYGIEEEAEGSREHLWVVDPIDGTFNYRFGIPLYGVVLAYCEQRVPVVGAICLPALGELFAAAKGMGARLHRAPDDEGETIGVDAATDPNQMVFVVEGNDMRSVMNAYFEAGLPQRSFRSLLCAAVPVPYIAAGRMHACIITSLNVWDCAAGDIILREAGGPACTDERGVPIFPEYLNRKVDGNSKEKFAFLAAASDHALALSRDVLAKAGFDISAKGS